MGVSLIKPQNDFVQRTRGSQNQVELMTETVYELMSCHIAYYTYELRFGHSFRLDIFK